MPKLAVLTLTRTPELLGRMTEAVAKQQGLRYDWAHLVLNNAEPGPAHDAIKYIAGVRGWTHCFYGEPVSFSRGNNGLATVAIRDCHADYLVLLNDDAVPLPDAFAAIETAIDLRPQHIIGTLLLEEDPIGAHVVNHAGHDPRRPDPHIGRGQDPTRYVGMGLRGVPATTFAFAVVPAGLWAELDGLDEGYVYGFEDTDFCFRARERGALIAIQQNAVAWHAECGTRPRGGARDRQNAERFMARWGTSRFMEKD